MIKMTEDRNYKESVEIYKVDLESVSLIPIITIDSKEQVDCGYPAVLVKNSIVYLVYYSGNTTKSDIYLSFLKP